MKITESATFYSRRVRVCLFVFDVVQRVNGPHKPKYKIYERHLREHDQCLTHTFVDKQTNRQTSWVASQDWTKKYPHHFFSSSKKQNIVNNDNSNEPTYATPMVWYLHLHLHLVWNSRKNNEIKNSNSKIKAIAMGLETPVKSLKSTHHHHP